MEQLRCSIFFTIYTYRNGGTMRIDKFLKNSRLIKRRAVAKDACDAGRVSVNGKTAKAGTDVEVGDVITIVFGQKEISARVLALTDSAKKDDAENMYEII
jgi:ribosomal 50S subunit-recycling heat shock protein